MTTPFSDVLGHEYAREGLWRSIADGRLHHAILLHGLRGVGKRTLAERVARTLICDSPDHGPCEICTHCRRTREHLHPDMVVIDRERILGIDEKLVERGDERVREARKRGRAAEEAEAERVGRSIGVEFMRDLGSWLTQKPWEARRRAAIVVDAERMTVPAANAFLKSLEEPAPGAVVLLTSSASAFLRPTIRSRCAAVRLSGVPQALLEEKLMAGGIDLKEARFRAQAAGGSMARALQARAPLDDLRDQILLRFSGGEDAEIAAFAAASTAASKETDREAALHLFATLLRDIAVVRAGGPQHSLVHSEAAEGLERAAAGPIDVFALFARVVEGRERVAGNANKLLLWDDLLHDASRTS